MTRPAATLIALCSLLTVPACLLTPDDLAGRTCKTDNECPESFYRCQARRPDAGKTCEVVFPPVPFVPDAGAADAGRVFYCSEAKPLLDRYCLAMCHNPPFSGSGLTNFDLSYYEPPPVGGVPGAKANVAEIKVRMVDRVPSPMPPVSFQPQPTDSERQLIAAWVAQGARLCADAGR